jgi:uncharacterized protein YpmS
MMFAVQYQHWLLFSRRQLIALLTLLLLVIAVTMFAWRNIPATLTTSNAFKKETSLRNHSTGNWENVPVESPSPNEAEQSLHLPLAAWEIQSVSTCCQPPSGTPS